MSFHSGPSDTMLTRVVRAPISANGTATNSAAIDMTGWSAARFVITLGILGTNGTVDANVISSDNSNLSGAAVINGSALTQVVNANTVQIIDVFNPQKRYIALQTTGQTNGCLISATVDLYRRSGILPPTQVAEQYKRVVDL